MKILALVTGAYGERGGIAQANRDLIEALVEEPSVENIIIFPRIVKTDAKPANSKIRQLRSAPNSFVYSFLALTMFLGREKFDVIFCGHVFMAPLAFVLRTLFGVPFWTHIHGTDVWNKPSPIVRKCAESSNFVTSVSRYTRSKFLKWANIAPSKVLVLPNTISSEYCPDGGSSKLIEKWDLKDKFVLLTVGRLAKNEQYKGHDYVLDAIHSLVGEIPNIFYLIAGEGDDQERLEKKVKDLQLGEKIKFLGYVEDSSLPDLYRSANLFVMPSSGEGFGIVFLEAMGCGLPVLGLEGNGSRDALQDGKLGKMINLKDLSHEIQKSFKASNESREELSARVQSVFGKEKFKRYAHKILAKNFS